MSAARDNRPEVTPLYLNSGLRGEAAVDLAHQLYVVLNSRLPVRVNTLSDVPEGSLHVSEPKLSVALLWKRMLAERPQKPMLECTRARAAQDFEKGYAESVAHHKRRTGEAARDGELFRHAA